MFDARPTINQGHATQLNHSADLTKKLLKVQNTEKRVSTEWYYDRYSTTALILLYYIVHHSVFFRAVEIKLFRNPLNIINHNIAYIPHEKVFAA